MQLNFSPWKIEQDVFDPSAEPELQQQLAISNGYISENACFDEHYSGEARPNVYLRDVATPLILPPVLSVRLHEERMDLSTWKIESFYRCQYRQEPKLERSFLATSPSGATFKVKSLRWIPNMNRWYIVNMR